MPRFSKAIIRDSRRGIAEVCVQCRCVVANDSGASCGNCGSDERITLRRDIYSDARDIKAPALYDRGELWSVLLLPVAIVVLLIIAGSSGSHVLTIAASLALLACSGMLAWGFPAMRQRHRLRLIMRARRRALPQSRWRQDPDDTADTVEIRGHARRLRAETTGPLSSRSCLLTAVDLVDFLVVDSDSQPHLVTGTIWLEESPPELTRSANDIELHVGEFKLPCNIVQGGTVNETCIRDGDSIVVRGRLVHEAHPDMIQSYRDPTTKVLRGEPGRPIAVSKATEARALAVY